VISAVAYSAAYDCDPGRQFGLSDPCENEGWIRFGIFVGLFLASWLTAVMVLWFAYVLRLLSDIEARLPALRQ
jgi:hypothetical protein